MFRFLSFISKIIIPIAIILFSILTVLPESNIHTDVLRNDNFYTKVSTEIKKNIYFLNDENLNKLASGFATRDQVKENPTLVDLYSSALTTEQIEITVKSTIENQFKDVENTFKQNITVKETDTISQLRNIGVSLYQYRLILIASVIVLMLLVLISALFTNHRHFALISKFYIGLSMSLVTGLLTTIIGFTGWAFAGTLSKQFLNNYFETNGVGVGLLDTINWQYAKFVIYLLIPAIAFLGLAIFLAAAFGFLSFFQRETNEEKEVKFSLNNKPVYEKISSLEAMNNTIVDNRIGSYVNEQRPEEINFESRTEPKKNIFKPITNTPFPIPEPKTRESLDPFLDRLSNSISADGSSMDNSKIVVRSDKR